jgi:hypothetical protein
MLLWMLTALAVEPATCPPAEELAETERWMRAVSLDVRGVIPSPEDYQQITTPGELPEDLLDSWLASDAFVEQAVREHRGRFWNRFGNTLQFADNRNRFRRTNGVLWVQARASGYRGSVRYCGDFPAADTDADGAWDQNADGQEGWVEVHPYWSADPDEVVRVCAFDAAETAVSVEGVACDTRAGATEPDCGCGPDLQNCIENTAQIALRDAMGRGLDERVAAVIREDRPYTDLFFEDRLYVNGPLVHFYRHLSQVSNNVRFDEVPFDLDALPDLPFTATDTWATVPTDPSSAGMLTDPAFLLRFMTQRSRVDRFYNEILCQPLLAPANGIDLDAPDTLDLSQRAGCAYCHAIIEPATVYWGRYTEGGGAWLDPAEHPAYDPACYQCSEDGLPCPSDCRSNYTVDPRDDELDPYVGLMKALQFRTVAEYARLDQGPGALVASNMATGQVSGCLTEKTAQWLLGREVGPTDEDVLATWETDLLASDWSYRELVKRIVLSPTYRRVR